MAAEGWRDRRVLALSAVLVVLLVVIAALWWNRRVGSSERLREDAGFGTLTDEQAQATRDYLAHDGAPLLDLATFGRRIVALADGDAATAGRECTGMVEEWTTLASTGDEGTIVALLRPLPDPTLGQLWASQVSALTEVMVLCEEDLGEAATELFGPVADVQEAVDLRLDDLGVER